VVSSEQPALSEGRFFYGKGYEREEMLKHKSVRYIFFVTLCVGIFIPLFNIYFVYPSFTRILTKNMEDDALRTATHFTSMFQREYAGLAEGSVSSDFINKIKMFQNDFQFKNIKFFSNQGKTVYSPDPEDAGKTKLPPRFLEFLAQGNSYSKSLKKGDISIEGETENRDRIEMYIPSVQNDTFYGAFKIGYDISQRNHVLSKVLFKASLIPFLMMFGGFTLTILVLVQLDRSITRQKKAEVELRDYAEKLQHSNRELECFAHIASHDLQEPLRKVIAFGKRLSYRYTDVIDDQGRDYLRRMDSASKRMQNLITSLLNYSRVSTKTQAFVPVDLSKLAQEVVSDLEVSIEKKSAHVEIGDLDTIEADPLQMRQLLQNLIGNALKFSRKDTPPEVQIHGRIIHRNGDQEYSSSVRDCYQLTVKDNGIGFEEKYADRIFDIFQRLHGRQQYEGTGIGLSICRRIVDRHNGEITATSIPEQGTIFTVTLPLKKEKGGNNE
jgi:signal transduction histidine kinase